MDDHASAGADGADGHCRAAPPTESPEASQPAQPSDKDGRPSDRADRVAERIAIPVLVAALASVPAVFLTLFSDPWESIGNGLNTMSGAVLVAETVVLFAVSDDPRAWLKRNKWLVGLAIAIIPAVIFAVGPMQLLRLARVVRVFGALRILRVKRIFKAGKILRERTGLTQTWQRVIGVVATALCAAFVALVLADTTSASYGFVSDAVDWLGWVGVVAAGIIIAGATYVVRVQRQRDAGSD